MIYTWYVVKDKICIVHHCWNEDIKSFPDIKTALAYMNMEFKHV